MKKFYKNVAVIFLGIALLNYCATRQIPFFNDENRAEKALDDAFKENLTAKEVIDFLELAVKNPNFFKENNIFNLSIEVFDPINNDYHSLAIIIAGELLTPNFDIFDDYMYTYLGEGGLTGKYRRDDFNMLDLETAYYLLESSSTFKKQGPFRVSLDLNGSAFKLDCYINSTEVNVSNENQPKTYVENYYTFYSLNGKPLFEVSPYTTLFYPDSHELPRSLTMNLIRTLGEFCVEEPSEGTVLK